MSFKKMSPALLWLVVCSLTAATSRVSAGDHVDRSALDSNGTAIEPVEPDQPHAASASQLDPAGNATIELPPANTTDLQPAAQPRTLVDNLVLLALRTHSLLAQLRRSDVHGLSRAISQNLFLAIGLPFLSGLFTGLFLVLLLHLLRLCYRRLFFRRHFLRKHSVLRRKNLPGRRETHHLLGDPDAESEYDV